MTACSVDEFSGHLRGSEIRECRNRRQSKLGLPPWQKQRNRMESIWGGLFRRRAGELGWVPGSDADRKRPSARDLWHNAMHAQAQCHGAGAQHHFPFPISPPQLDSRDPLRLDASSVKHRARKTAKFCIVQPIGLERQGTLADSQITA